MTKPLERVLVTGGAGFIGSHLVAALLQRGHSVLAYDSLVVGRATSLTPSPRLELVTADLNDPALDATLNRFCPELVIHLAALHYIPYCIAHPDETWRANVLGTQALIDACARYPVKKIVFASSAAVYPNRLGALEESLIPEPIEIYGESKLKGEELLTAFNRRTNTPVAMARLFNVYGDAETNNHVIPRILGQVRKGNILELGNLTPERDYVFVDDVVDALLCLAFSECDSAIVNIGTGQSHSVSEVVRLMSEILQRQLSVRQLVEYMRTNERQQLCANVSRMAGLFGWRARFDLRSGLTLLLQREGLC